MAAAAAVPAAACGAWPVPLTPKATEAAHAEEAARAVAAKALEARLVAAGEAAPATLYEDEHLVRKRAARARLLARAALTPHAALSWR